METDHESEPEAAKARRALAKVERRLALIDATAASIESLGQGPDLPPLDARQTAPGFEAFYDGLWLNLLLRPEDFKRLACRQRAIEHPAAFFPARIAALQAVARRHASPDKASF